MRAVGNQCVGKLMNAWEASCKFDQAAGMRTNKKKTEAYANGEDVEKVLSRALNDRGDEDNKTVREFVLVGGQVVVRGAPGHKKRIAKRKGVIWDLQRILWSGMNMDVNGAFAKNKAVANQCMALRWSACQELTRMLLGERSVGSAGSMGRG